MRKYVLKRIFLAIFTAFVILSVTFFLVKLLPFQAPVGQAIDYYRFYEEQVTQGYVVVFEAPNEAYGELLWTTAGTNVVQGGMTYYYYQRSIPEQYIEWLRNIFLRWEWGTSTSIQVNYDAISIIGDRLPVTISINIWSVLISVPTGIGLGIWAALKKNKPTDHIISTIVMVFISIPSFIIISLLIKWFAYDTGWLPSAWPSVNASIGRKISGYVIPVMALCFGSICGYCRFTRAELCEVLSSDYLLLARTKGLTRTQCITRHALRNAMVPIVPSILAEFIGLLSGSMILENLYNIRGIGSLFVSAINDRDYNVLMADMAMFTLISLFANVFLDISYGFIDPRIRMGAKNNA